MDKPVETEWRRAVYKEDEKFNRIELPDSWVVVPDISMCWYAVLCDRSTGKPVDVYDLPEVIE